MGMLSSPASRSRGRRDMASETLPVQVTGRTSDVWVLELIGSGQLLRRLLHAFVHSEYGTHVVSVRPSRQPDCGVDQNQICLK